MKRVSLGKLFFLIALVALAGVVLGSVYRFPMEPNQRVTLQICLWVLMGAGIAVWASTIYLGRKRRLPTK